MNFSFQKLNQCGFVLSSIAMLTVIFANYPFQQPDSTLSPLYYGLYDALSRVTWSIALCYIIFSCVHNSDCAVNRFLSHPSWQPFSRLSFAIYMVHPLVLVTSMASIKTSPYFNEILFLRDFIGNCVISIILSAFASLAFESPIVNIEKLIFRSERKGESLKKSHWKLQMKEIKKFSGNIFWSRMAKGTKMCFCGTPEFIHIAHTKSSALTHIRESAYNWRQM